MRNLFWWSREQGNQLWFYFIAINTHSRLFYYYQAARCDMNEMQNCEINCKCLLGMDRFGSNQLNWQWLIIFGQITRLPPLHDYQAVPRDRIEEQTCEMVDCNVLGPDCQVWLTLHNNRSNQLNCEWLMRFGELLPKLFHTKQPDATGMRFKHVRWLIAISWGGGLCLWHT
jgi:hypothetical protein